MQQVEFNTELVESVGWQESVGRLSRSNRKTRTEKFLPVAESGSVGIDRLIVPK